MILAGLESVLQNSHRSIAYMCYEQFHDSAAMCNAYVVFAHPPPDRPKNLPPTLDPFIAAAQVLVANCSTFMDHIIRVDSAHARTLPSSSEPGEGQLSRQKEDWPGGADPKSSIFVGGLDYETKEDDLRSYFEGLIVKERGERAEKYVTGVRIIRDRDTQLGKGFGYVHFTVSIVAIAVSSLSTRKPMLKLDPPTGRRKCRRDDGDRRQNQISQASYSDSAVQSPQIGLSHSQDGCQSDEAGHVEGIRLQDYSAELSSQSDAKGRSESRRQDKGSVKGRT